MWKILESGKNPPQVNMDKDSELLSSMQLSQKSILHLYEWEGSSATYGHFVNLEDYFCLDAVRDSGLQLGKRPTGGGIIFHDCDLAFSILIPSISKNFSTNTLENYAFVNQKVSELLQDYLNMKTAPSLLVDSCDTNAPCHARFCMAKPTIYDLMIGDKKIGGAAQRKTRWGFLHQGSIHICTPPEELLHKVLKNSSELVQAMKENSYSILPGQPDKAEIEACRKEIREQLKSCFR